MVCWIGSCCSSITKQLASIGRKIYTLFHRLLPYYFMEYRTIPILKKNKIACFVVQNRLFWASKPIVLNWIIMDKKIGFVRFWFSATYKLVKISTYFLIFAQCFSFILELYAKNKRSWKLYAFNSFFLSLGVYFCFCLTSSELWRTLSVTVFEVFS